MTDGRIGAAEVPGTGALLLEAETLRRDLDALGPQRGGDAELVDDYRAYIGALERMVRLLALLARPVPRGGRGAPAAQRPMNCGPCGGSRKSGSGAEPAGCG
ncbi:hypothetical protein ACH4C2_05670 [Streptomyces sp. NPDC018057]|uniref:hypothetical protein n=1 Tax=unclassified Streptomyces TaxID=2593676 RepID=UPI0037B6C5AB